MLTPYQGSVGRSQRGLSMVEMLVGVAVGLFIVAGAVTLFVTNLGNSRRLLVEARVNQDLRAAADLIARDVRRAGYWASAIKGTYAPPGAASAPVNPYQAIASAPSQVTYAFSRDANQATPIVDNDNPDTYERFGFRLTGGTVQMQTANGSWQDLTDPSVVTVSGFAVTQDAIAPIDIRASCSKPCTSNCPVIQVRRFSIVITGQAVADPSVIRTLRTGARVRNDAVSGECPL